MSGALLAEAADPVFARHQTFMLRFGWLNKVFTVTDQDPDVFTAEDATVRLGVGKNMVAAMKFWGQAYGIIQPAPSNGRGRSSSFEPTRFGRHVFSEDGWDPWMEDEGTKWLLHWKLMSPKTQVPVWWVAFNMAPGERFTENQLINLTEELSAAAGWRKVNTSSIKKDVLCLINTFTSRATSASKTHEILESPARSLGLLQPADAHSAWRFNVGPKPTLPPEIVAFAALDYVATHNPADTTISIARLAHDPGSPGRTFKLTETALFEVLQNAEKMVDGIRVVEPGGLRQLVVETFLDAGTLRDTVLPAYYRRKGVQNEQYAKLTHLFTR